MASSQIPMAVVTTLVQQPLRGKKRKHLTPALISQTALSRCLFCPCLKPFYFFDFNFQPHCLDSILIIYSLCGLLMGYSDCERGTIAVSWSLFFLIDLSIFNNFYMIPTISQCILCMRVRLNPRQREHVLA